MPDSSKKKVITGANAIISISTPTGIVPFGLCENVNIEERTPHTPVVELGNLFASSMEVLNFEGSGSIGLFNGIYRNNEALLKLDNRIASTIEEWTAYLTTKLKEEGAILSIQTRVRVGVDEKGLALTELKTIAEAKYVFINSQSVNFATGQISKRSIQFVYTNPYIEIP